MDQTLQALSAVFAVSMSSRFYSALLIYFYLAFQKQEHLSCLPCRPTGLGDSYLGLVK